MVTVSPAESVTGVEVSDDFVINVAEPTEAIEKEVEAIAQAVAEAPIVTYFPEEIQTVLAELVEDPAALIGYEVAAVAADNYDPEYGDVAAGISFATEFPEGSEVIVMIKTVDWSVQKVVVEDGKLKVTFTAEELVFMENGAALMLVLANEVAE